MKLTKPSPPDHVRVTITKQKEVTESFSVYETTQEEFVDFAQNIIKPKIDIFAGGRTITISIRKCTHTGDGTSISMHFKGMTPKEVKEIIINAIHEYTKSKE